MRTLKPTCMKNRDAPYFFFGRDVKVGHIALLASRSTTVPRSCVGWLLCICACINRISIYSCKDCCGSGVTVEKRCSQAPASTGRVLGGYDKIFLRKLWWSSRTLVGEGGRRGGSHD